MALICTFRPANAWRVQLDDENRLLWVSGEETMDEQPARDIMQRITDDILSIMPLPIEQL